MVRSTRPVFRERYDSGAIPIAVAHRGVNAVTWRADPGSLDASTYLPLFVEGMRETRHPYRLLAVRGASELSRACGERALLEALPRMVLPLKAALEDDDPAVVAVALEFTRELANGSSVIGEALVPYYRQLLPAMNGLKDVKDVYVSLAVLSDARAWRERRGPSLHADDVHHIHDLRPASRSSRVHDHQLPGRGRSKRSIAALVRAALRALEASGGADARANITYLIPAHVSARVR